ncbi:MAG: hypothetical protein ACRDO8_04465 [Nocardioidaceae bacterium]
MRAYLSAASMSGVVAFVAGLALHAPGPVLAVAAIAGATALAAWLSSAQSTDTEAGLALSNPAWTLTLVLRGRRRATDLLPLWAAQVVGALVAGLVVQALGDRLPGPLVWPSADLVATGVVALVLGIVSAWVACAADTYVSEGLTGLPVLAAGAALPLNLAAVLNPATLFGITVAGLLDWQPAAIGAAGAILGAALGAWSAGPVTVNPE